MKKKVVKCGNSGHVQVPKKFIGKTVDVLYGEETPFPKDAKGLVDDGVVIVEEQMKEEIRIIDECKHFDKRAYNCTKKNSPCTFPDKRECKERE